jgi:hypothetical protein
MELHTATSHGLSAYARSNRKEKRRSRRLIGITATILQLLSAPS